MTDDKLPKFSSLKALRDFFDANDTGDYWEEMPEVDVESSIAKKMRLIAMRGTLDIVGTEALDQADLEEQANLEH